MPPSAGGIGPARRPGCSAKPTRQPALAGGVFHPSPARRPSKIFSGHDALPAARNRPACPSRYPEQRVSSGTALVYKRVLSLRIFDSSPSNHQSIANLSQTSLSTRKRSNGLGYHNLSKQHCYQYSHQPRGTLTLLPDPTSSMDQPTNTSSAAAAADTSTPAGLQGQQLMILLTPEQMASVRDQIRVRKASAAGLVQDWKEYAGTGGVKLVLTVDQVVELGRGMGLDDGMEEEDEDEETDEEDYEDYYDGSSEEPSGRGKRKRGEEEEEEQGEGDGAGSSKPAKSAKKGGEGEGGGGDAEGGGVAGV
ncbi:hypothetical protein V8F06_010811 [Rhypophila decipiens]